MLSILKYISSEYMKFAFNIIWVYGFNFQDLNHALLLDMNIYDLFDGI